MEVVGAEGPSLPSAGLFPPEGSPAGSLLLLGEAGGPWGGGGRGEGFSG